MQDASPLLRLDRKQGEGDAGSTLDIFPRLGAPIKIQFEKGPTNLDATLLKERGGFDVPPLRLSAIARNGKKEIEFDYEKAGKDSAFMRRNYVTENRKSDLEWNLKTGEVMRDGDWQYSYEAVRGSLLPVTIRKNADGIYERYLNDSAGGLHIKQTLGGPIAVRQSFASGPLFGKIRKITETTGGVTTLMRKFSYDENGKFLFEQRTKQNKTTTLTLP